VPVVAFRRSSYKIGKDNGLCTLTLNRPDSHRFKGASPTGTQLYGYVRKTPAQFDHPYRSALFLRRAQRFQPKRAFTSRWGPIRRADFARVFRAGVGGDEVGLAEAMRYQPVGTQSPAVRDIPLQPPVSLGNLSFVAHAANRIAVAVDVDGYVGMLLEGSGASSRIGTASGRILALVEIEVHARAGRYAPGEPWRRR
jgi:hypothetical protein